MSEVNLADLIRNIPDFPIPGIQFKDITTLLRDGRAFRQVVDTFAERYADRGIDAVVGVESRGFILSAPLAYRLGVGLVPVRKAGKLPKVAASRTYQLEYGTATLELPADTVEPGTDVFLVDDVLATGGTAAAACDLVASAGGRVIGFGVLLEIDGLGGRERLGDVPVHALLTD